MSATPSTPPSVVIVMGVSGSGKTTIAALLAGVLHWELADADAFHPATNIEKMRNGIPLTDEDRSPWLHAISVWIDAVRAARRHGIVACSALKRAYRQILIGDRRDVQLVYLSGNFELIAHRMAMRHEHFMPLALLQSQFDTLEPPGPDEHPLTVSIDASPQEIAAMIVAALRLQGTEQQVT